MGNFWLGAMTGIGELQQQDKLRQVQENIALSKRMHDDFMKMMEHPDITDEGRQRAEQALQQLYGLDPAASNFSTKAQKLGQLDMTRMFKTDAET